MFRKLIDFFSFSDWPLEYQPVRHTFFRDSKLAEILNHTGYYIADFIGEKERLLLLDVYKKHQQKDEYEVQYEERDTGSAGAYMGVISQTVHQSINEILGPAFDKWFINYKSAVNAFAVKTPGNSGQVPVHQDVSDLDEEKYSTISIWLPLQTMSEENGTLQIIPRSHHIFVPYRASTLEPLTKNIEPLLTPYFVPLYLKAGQALFFDSRLFHQSPPNLSKENRVVALCRICPQDAPIVTYYKDPLVSDSKVEMWQCPDDYLIYSENHEEKRPPKNGKFLGYKNANISPITPEEFERRRRKLGILPFQNKTELN